MNPVNLSDQVIQARNELHNLRKTIRGLQAQHKKDVLRLQSLLTENKALTVTKNTIYTQKFQDAIPSKLLCSNWTPIGYMKSWFKTKNGTPRQGSVSSLTRGRIKILKSIFNNPEHSLQGLELYSHVWIFFVFDQNSGDGNGHSKAKVSPPRLDGERVGVFSTRSPHRPNPLGLTLATIEKVEGDCIYLSGLDILDGTPVLDIKPYIFQYDAPSAVVSHIQDSEVRDNWDFSESYKTQIPHAVINGPEQTATCTTMKKEEGLLETEEELLNSHVSVDSNFILPSIDTSKTKMCKLQEKKVHSSPSQHSYNKKDDFHEQHLGDDVVNSKLQIENNFKHTKPSSTKIIVQENEVDEQFSLPNYLSGKSKVVENVKEDSTFRLPLVNLGSRTSHLPSDSESVVPSYSGSNNASKDIESKTYSRDFESDNIPRDIDSSIVPRDSDSIRILRDSESINLLGDSESINDLTSHQTQSNTYSSNRGPVIEECDSYNSTRERMSESINDISPQSLTTANDSTQGKVEKYGVLSASWVKSPPLRQLQVHFNPIADGQINQFSRTAQEASYRLEFLSDGVELRGAISSVLSEDPRSIYRRHKCPSLLYYFTVDTAHVTAWFDDALVEVLRVKPLGDQSLDHGVASEQAAGMKKDSKVII